MSTFADGIDACTGSGSGGEYGFWFYKRDQAVKTDKDGERAVMGPSDITAREAWPALNGTPFANQIDDAVFSSSGFWFFKGNHAIKTDSSGNHVVKATSDVTSPGYWQGLAGTEFAQGIDAATESGPGGEYGFWFFRGAKAIKLDKHGESVEIGPTRITSDEAWPALAGTPLESGVDAALSSSSGFWFFKGNQAIKTDKSGRDIVRHGLISAAGNWPGLNVSADRRVAAR